MSSTKRASALKSVRLATGTQTGKKIVSVRMAESVIQSIKMAMEQEGLGSRKRSQWVSTAIKMLENEFSLISFEDQCLFIRQSQSISGQGSSVPITLDHPTFALLQARLRFCAKNTPEVQDAQSRMLHLAITLYLVRRGIKLA